MNLKELMISWADEYETAHFIQTDPIQFPHRFTDKRDIEISGFITSYLAFGQRPQIIKRVSELHAIMGNSPYEYVMNGDFSIFWGNHKFYRFISYSDMNELFSCLKACYLNHPDMETAVGSFGHSHPALGLQELFGHIHYIPPVDSSSACKRIHMFLRWMCRQNSPVDIGIWKSVDPAELLIPLDTHVHNMGLKLGITERKTADMITARQIYHFFKKIFPDDPGRGDFSLFGYSVNN